MGLLDLFNKKSEEEREAMEANKKILAQFNTTAAWGVKKYPAADQFIYDEDLKAFCIAGGPADHDQWKEKNPYVIRFDQVEDVCLYVDEWWSENDDKYDKFHDSHVLTIDKYDEVFWKYDLYVRFRTTHPFAGKIEYKMNWHTNILMIPGIHLIARRGLELNGEYRGKEITEKRTELEEYAQSLKNSLTDEKILQIIAKQRPDSIIGRMKKDLTNEWYVSRVENIAAHIRRSEKIAKLINSNK